jgi:curli biogenesis system outer membrane secretion channel CsgG
MQQKFKEAVSACSQSLALGAPQPATLNNLGYSNFKLGELSQATAAYLRAVELAPQWAPPYSGLGAVYLTQQDWMQAEKYYRLALDRDPGNALDRQALEGAMRMQRNVSAVPPMSPDAGRAPSGAPAGDAGAIGSAPRQSVQASPQTGAGTGRALGSAETVPDGRKVIIAIGDFQVKAAGAGQFIGDGMREMLVTALHNSGNYVVVERMDLPGLAAEQALSRSRMARPGAAIGESQMDVAEIMVYAAVTEFESEAKGGGVQFGIPNLPLNLGRQTKTAHMAIDMRVVDVATGRLIAAQRISGEAKSSQTSVGTVLSVGGTSIPTSLGSFKNTPMEQAIRECIQKATAYITSNTPQQYFRHQ